MEMADGANGVGGESGGVDRRRAVLGGGAGLGAAPPPCHVSLLRLLRPRHFQPSVLEQ